MINTFQLNSSIVKISIYQDFALAKQKFSNKIIFDSCYFE
jgi:hypothetical protein